MALVGDPGLEGTRGPSGTDSAMVSRSCSYSASLRMWASSCTGASRAGSAPKKSLSSAGHRSWGMASVASARHSARAARPASVMA